MTLSHDQAAESLKEIERTGRRSASAYSYASASPYLLLWGATWVIGYAGSYFLQANAGWLWIGLTVVGVVGSTLIGRACRAGRVSSPGTAFGWRFFGAFVVIFVFIAATYAIMQPTNPLVQGAFVPLVVAMFYCLLGLWQGVRLLVTGVVVAALTLIGFFWLPQYFLLWMAAVGGGSLILLGLWLRKV